MLGIKKKAAEESKSAGRGAGRGAGGAGGGPGPAGRESRAASTPCSLGAYRVDACARHLPWCTIHCSSVTHVTAGVWVAWLRPRRRRTALTHVDACGSVVMTHACGPSWSVAGYQRGSRWCWPW